MFVVTHAHSDHTGSAINYFSELYFGAGDAASRLPSTDKGKIRELKDGDVIDLGGRTPDEGFARTGGLLITYLGARMSEHHIVSAFRM
jgi:glyoxylase-like metal-dependent hydrolase (beta-lactamase superfamily II)